MYEFGMDLCVKENRALTLVMTLHIVLSARYFKQIVIKNQFLKFT